MNKLGKLLWVSCISTSLLLAGLLIFIMVAVESARTPDMLLRLIIAVVALILYAYFVLKLRKEFCQEIEGGEK